MTRAVQRVFTKDFKEAAVARIVAGEAVRALAQELDVLRKDLYRWRDQFRDTGVVGKPRGRPRLALARPPDEGDLDDLSQARRRIAELERKVGQQQIDLDFFQGALRRVAEAQRPIATAGAAPSMPRSGQ